MHRIHRDGAVAGWLRDNVLALVLFCVLAVMTARGLNSASGVSREEQLRLAAQAVRRAAVSCYAVEGFYPDSLDYLEEHYDVRVDPKKYVVSYEVFGSNIMPEITVMEVAP